MDFTHEFSLPEAQDDVLFADMVLRLRYPDKPVDIVIDTDAFNEVDDQFAIIYALASSDKLHLKAILAAPFQNHNAPSPEEGMYRSFDEIQKILQLSGYNNYSKRVFHGATCYIPNENTPLESDAVHELIRIAMEHSRENPLYVVCIAAPTNVASAILMKPEICDRIVVIWSGGVSLGWPNCNCFNGGQSVAASRVLLGANVPIVLTPGRAMADRLLTTGPELSFWLDGKNDFCTYIVQKVIREAETCNAGKVWSRPLTDVVPIGWLTGGHRFMLDRFEQRPMIEYDRYYSFDPRRPMMRYVYYIKRDELLEDLFEKLSNL